MSNKRRRRRRNAGTRRAGTGRQIKSPQPALGTGPDPKIPRWLPWILFPGLTVVLFAPFIFSDGMLFGTDTLAAGYQIRTLFADAIAAQGGIPRWQPEILGGTPYIEALSAGDALYPPSLLLLLLTDTYRALGWKLVVHVAAAGFFMFGWVRTLGASRAAALVAGTGYMLAPVMVSLVYPGHDGKLFVTALTPLLFRLTERHFVRPGLASFTGVALAVAAVLLTPHFQMAYFLFGATGAFAIFRAVQLLRSGAEESDEPSGPSTRGMARRRAVTRFSLFLLASIAGAVIAGGQLVPAVAHVTEYSRRTATTAEQAGEAGRAWSSSWSLHPEEAFSMVIPEFVGSNAGREAGWASNTYWGRNPFKLNSEYAGLILLLLAAVSFAGGAKPAVRWFLAGLAAFVLLFAMGAHTPVWRIAYEAVPGIRLFRAVSMSMFLFGFAVATLAALGVDRLLTAGRNGRGIERVQGVLRWGTGILAVVALLAGTGRLKSLWTAVFEIDEQRLAMLETASPHIAAGSLVALLLTAFLAVLAWAYRKTHLGPAPLLAGIVALVAVDAMRVDRAFIQVMDFHDWAAPDANIRAVLDQERGNPEPYRLLSFRRGGQDLDPAAHGIELAAGHHPNDLARYRELIGMVGSGLPLNLAESTNIRRLLNVRYILWPDLAMGRSLAESAFSRTFAAGDRVLESIHEAPGLPRARLVASAVVKRDEEAVPYLLSDDFDPEVEVVLAETPPLELDGGPVFGSVIWLERRSDRLRLDVESDRPALLVIADNWYPGWRARVSGEETAVLRAYHTLRAIPVPAGRSNVEMWYESDLVDRTFLLGIMVFVGLLLANAAQLSVRRLRARSARSSR